MKGLTFGLVLMLLLVTSVSLQAQEKKETEEPVPLKEMWLKKNEDFKFNIRMMVQLWTLYTMDQEVYNAETGIYEGVDDRFNTNLRRARLIMSGQPYPRLKYSLAMFYDLAGRDLLSASVGGTNPAQPNFGVWDGFFQYQLSKGSQSAWLTGGWFRPQMQRESITSGWSVNSFEKSMSQNYLRRHLVGTGPGRAAGLNIGGLFQGEKVGLNYNLGVFNPLTTSPLGQTVGQEFAPLIAGRAVLYLGDPELTKYKIGYETNFYNKRKGVSLDFNASYQGQTDLFEESIAFGPGMLLNWGPLNLDGEWMFMTRSGTRSVLDGGARAFDYTSNTGHVRVGYNITVGKYMLEPVFMVMQFNGGETAEEQADASAVGSFSGSEQTYDAGVNFYLDRRNLKLMLHYTWRDGDPGAAGDGARVNQFFSQGGIGAIRRGNWLGLGLHAIF
ncbi:MAG: porin [Phaeodactylibacter sp.]|uniref:porin n=1 Tax=Phaeodactylibacter sp. TaxID=1940289 RepID=UPI0032EF6412